MSTTFTPYQTRTLSRLGVLSQALALTHWAVIGTLKTALEDLAFMADEERPHYEQSIVSKLIATPDN